MNYITFGIIAYLLGSIPTAVWVGKNKYKIDIREHGSKNAGATNTFRVLGKKAGIFVLSIDIFKGFLATFLPYLFNVGSWQSDELFKVQILAALLAVVGHVYPVFAGFRGGKGVATSLGVIIGLHPPAAGICLAVFLIVFIISHYVSLGAICASITFPLSIYFVFGIESIWLNSFTIILASMVIIKHKKNIERLIAGNENKMKLFKK